jgi:hypothetical protein
VHHVGRDDDPVFTPLQLLAHGEVPWHKLHY